MRLKFTYKCTECKMHNYIGNKNKTNHPDKMEVKKFCSKCNKQTMHKEFKNK